MTATKIPYSEAAEQTIEAAYDPWLSVGMDNRPADVASLTPLIERLYADMGEPAPGVVSIQSWGALPQDAIIVHRGSAEAWWVARYRVGQSLGVVYDKEDTQGLDDTEQLCRLSGGIAVSGDGRAVYVVDRPRVVAISEDGDRLMLHREGAPAIEYADGWGIHALYDVTIPAEASWIATQDRATLAGRATEIMAITNADVRRVAIRRVGIGAMLVALGAEEVHQDTMRTADGSEHPYRLLRVVMPGADGPSLALHMEYPSGPARGTPVVEMVPPWIKTCAEARAWRVFGSATRGGFDKRRREYVGPSALT